MRDLSCNMAQGVRLNKVTGLRFKADIPNALAEKVALFDEKSFGFVIAPAYYFEKAMEIDDQTDSNRDYVNDLAHLTEVYGAKPALQLVCEPVEENGKLIIQASVANILYNNTNLTYTAAAYVKTESNSGEYLTPMRRILKRTVWELRVRFPMSQRRRSTMKALIIPRKIERCCGSL